MGYRKTCSRWRAARGRLLTPEAIAYHEAGHVVVAYEFGWSVARGGVRLGVWAHARLRHRESDNIVLARVCVHMAGLLAEQKFYELEWHLQEDVVRHLRAVRAGEGLLDGVPGRALRRVHWSKEASSLRWGFVYWSAPARIKLISSYLIIGTMMEAIVR